MFTLLGPAPSAGRPLAIVAVPDEATAFADRIATVVSGVGKANASAAATWAILTLRPSALLNLGTAGALRDGADLRTGVHDVARVVQHDLDGRAVAALTGVDPAPPLVLRPRSGPVLATGDRFIASSSARDLLGQHADLVDMEGYAVASVAVRAGVPVRVVKTVSDDAGPGAARSWHASLVASSQRLAGWLEGYLAGD